MKKLIIFLSFLIFYGVCSAQSKIVITSSNALVNPMTTAGDMMIGGTSGVATRFPLAPHSGMKLTSIGTGLLFAWQDTAVAGGGSIGSDTVQAYTSGSTLTQNASTNYIQLNPASVQSVLTITTLASGGTWHTSNDLYIVAGGTVTSGNPVITTLTVTAGAGLTFVQAVTPTTITSGETIRYHKIGALLYRIN